MANIMPALKHGSNVAPAIFLSSFSEDYISNKEEETKGGSYLAKIKL